ncbi:MAG: response regulator [Planctomycetota bacterium]|jgi:DNA-binding NtrC family response regulator
MTDRKIRILVVDDEELFLASMQKRLDARDFDVVTVNRVEKAVEAARNERFDIALVDLKMPGMNGEETLEVLKSEHEFLEVVILTGHASIDSAVECTKAGAYSYLQKPCDFNQLLQVLAEAYKKRTMRKMQIEEEKMNEMLKLSVGESPLHILRKVKEIEEG